MLDTNLKIGKIGLEVGFLFYGHTVAHSMGLSSDMSDKNKNKK